MQRSLLWQATVVGAAVLFLGLAAAVVLAWIDGSMYSTRQPWTTIYLSAIGIGLIVSGVAGTAWVVVAGPIWAKLAVLIPAAIAALWWAVMLAVGLPTTGFGGSVRDPLTIIYSAPDLALAFVGLPTLAIILLAAGVWLMRKTPSRPAEH